MLINIVEGTQDVRSQYSCESLSSVEIGVLDDHYTFLRKELLGVVVNKLTINEDIRFVVQNFLDFHFHFFFLSCLNFGNFIHRINLNFWAMNFNFIIVHGSVCNKNSRILFQFRASNTDWLFKNKTFVKIGILNRTTWFLNNFNVVQIILASKSPHSLNSKLCKVLFVLIKELWTESRSRNIHKILSKQLFIILVISCAFSKLIMSNLHCKPISSNDCLRMHKCLKQLLRLTTKLSSKNGNSGCSIPNFLILRLRYVNNNFGGRVLYKHLL